ncbi:replication protein A 70 kDa DNA-binding subunit D-like [Coffea arabica]|uniref:Replication protein A 70 kDa DNA-binding subunit D-like n=1 Tax=Coffea arabica TaxID=13443 RepID=A0A6P6S389_COFAR
MEKLLAMKEIVPEMQSWTCKITVQEKQQITQSMSTPTKKQKFIFVDTEGSKVEGIIFNNDIPRMSSILQIYKKYKISNAEVRPILPKYQTAEITHQWTITSRTVIEEVFDDEDMMPVKFNCTKFRDLAQYMDDKAKSVDVLAIVIETLEKKTITTNYRESVVQKFVLVNEELQTVVLSMWDDFIKNEGEQIISAMNNYPVIIARRIKVNNYNGVSLSTWFDSAILVNPPIQEARELKNWAMRNSKELTLILEQKTYTRYNPEISLKPDQKTTLICNVNPSHKSTWVKAQFTFQHIFQKYWYMSCKKCYRGTAAAHGVIFSCNTCKEKHPAEPRCRFDMDLRDHTGVITASIFGEQAEQLLTFNALEIMEHFKQNIELPLETVHKELELKWFLVHIKPVQTQVADTKQRYTIIYYSEVVDAATQVSSVNESIVPFVSVHDQDDSSHITTSGTVTVEENNPTSKVRLSLNQKFDQAEEPENNASQLEGTSCSKKPKLN